MSVDEKYKGQFWWREYVYSAADGKTLIVGSGGHAVHAIADRGQKEGFQSAFRFYGMSELRTAAAIVCAAYADAHPELSVYEVLGYTPKLEPPALNTKESIVTEMNRLAGFCEPSRAKEWKRVIVAVEALSGPDKPKPFSKRMEEASKRARAIDNHMSTPFEWVSLVAIDHQRVLLDLVKTAQRHASEPTLLDSLTNLAATCQMCAEDLKLLELQWKQT